MFQSYRRSETIAESKQVLADERERPGAPWQSIDLWDRTEKTRNSIRRQQPEDLQRGVRPVKPQGVPNTILQ